MFYVNGAQNINFTFNFFPERGYRMVAVGGCKLGTQTVDRFYYEATQNIFECIYNLLYPPTICKRLNRCPTLFEINCSKDTIF